MDLITQDRDTRITKWLKESEIYDYVIINDKYFIGRYKVMYGVRVRGGNLFDYSCDFDVCCGKSKELADKVIQIYSKTVLLNFATGDRPAQGLKVMSDIKPIHKDLDFMKWLAKKEVKVNKRLKEEDLIF